MKTAIIYYSKHHGNTKKLLDAIAETGDVTLLDVADSKNVNLEEYDLIGMASGIYYQSFHDSVLQCVKERLPKYSKVFLVYTYGIKRDSYTAAAMRAVKLKGGDILGSYGCRGFDTFGPFKLVGGIAKGHPDEDDVAGVKTFFKKLCQEVRS